MNNFVSILILLAAWMLVIFMAMHSIDKMADRDCERGIKSACAYATSTDK